MPRGRQLPTFDCLRGFAGDGVTTFSPERFATGFEEMLFPASGLLELAEAPDSNGLAAFPSLHQKSSLQSPSKNEQVS